MMIDFYTVASLVFNQSTSERGSIHISTELFRPMPGKEAIEKLKKAVELRLEDIKREDLDFVIHYAVEYDAAEAIEWFPKIKLE